VNDILDRSLASGRFSADLVSGFGGLAMLLASIGIYGFAGPHGQPKIVRDRYHMALGARWNDILTTLLQDLRYGLRLAEGYIPPSLT
jgi:hypothetical protein